MRRILLVTTILPLVAGGCLARCATAPQSQSCTSAPALGNHRFTRTTSSARIQFVHKDGSSGRWYLPEVMGPGCAFLDLTGDELPDLYLLNGAELPGADPDETYGSQFYRNNGDGTFTDVTRASGLADGRYALGCCAGDYDNDGDVDLYVTHFGRNTLYRNNGDGTFSDVTDRARVGLQGFCTGASFGDYDGDGYLDLYACRYVKWTPESNIRCTQFEGKQAVSGNCRPTVYPMDRGVLYHNNGDGTFSDHTARSGVSLSERSLGCLWTDVDEDGDADLFVANDMGANFLYINRGRGRFHEEGMSRGVALGDSGEALASMGVWAGDYDGDGHLDLACTNFSGEYLNLYRNRGNGFYEDVSAEAGVMEPTSQYVGFGVGMPDLDLDGWADMVVVNGHVSESADRFMPGATINQPTLCFQGGQTARFELIPEPGGGLSVPRLSRGLAFADYDRDGDLDLLIANRGAEVDLVRNDTPGRGNWLRLKLRGVKCNRNAIGARVEVTAQGRSWIQEVYSGSSYLSQSEFPLTFGLGTSAKAEKVRVHWPGGGIQEWSDLAAKKQHTLTER